MDKYSGIDLLKLYSGTHPEFQNDFIITGRRFGKETSSAKADITKSANALKSHIKWNQWLTYCLHNNNLKELISVRYRLQVGMDDLVKKKMQTPEIAQMFVRWVGSIEKTARQIIKKQNPKPENLDETNLLRWTEYRKKLDHEFELFLRKSSY